MAKTHTRAEETPTPVRYPAGQRLRCRSCGAEVTITSPCPCHPPELLLRCCGDEMKPATGTEVRLEFVPPPAPDEVHFDDERTPFAGGERLLCPECGAEVEVTIPTPAHHPRQEFRCCGKDMVPTTPGEG
jgi:hypothetical protein